ncbi:MAG: hypothetical protein MH204_06485 [Fimbriimonadaceae bacterium]|nr:hypothetical protein [Fimbriimonadaceae bacterium]
MIGGFAMIIHGSNHVTQDIDLAITLADDNPENLARALNKLSPSLMNGRRILLDRFAFGGEFVRYLTDAGAIDFVRRGLPPDGFNGMWERRIEVEVEGVAIPVASLEDLLAMKEASERPKDTAHAAEIRALLRLRDEQGNEAQDRD